MRLTVRVVPGASRDTVVRDGETFKVCVMARAVDGKANEALVKALAEHFGVPKRSVVIVRGERSRRKIVELPDIAC